MSDLCPQLRLEGSRYGGIGVLYVDRNQGQRDTQPTCFGTTNSAHAVIENKRVLIHLIAGLLVGARQSGLCQDRPSPPSRIRHFTKSNEAPILLY